MKVEYPYFLDDLIHQKIVTLNFNSGYTITSFGFVYRKSDGYRLNRYVDASGYWSVDIADVHKRIHRMLAEHFIPNPENKRTVNHIDGDKLNCELSNLEWSTYSENNKHAYSIGLKTGAFTGKIGKLHARSRPVIKCDKQGNILQRYESIRQASISQGKSSSYVNSAIKRNSRGQRTNIIWKYAD